MHYVVIALVLALVSSPPAASTRQPAVTLDFDHLYAQSMGGARVAVEVEALAGKRVRIVGYMAQMEEPPPAAFYLTARPVLVDESGGGTGDLPPGAVRVELPGGDRDVPFVQGPLEVEGRLEVGRAEDAQGRVSFIRIVVDLPPARGGGATRSQHPARPTRGSSRSSRRPGGQ